jgi:hypothetical protein
VSGGTGNLIYDWCFPIKVVSQQFSVSLIVFFLAFVLMEETTFSFFGPSFDDDISSGVGRSNFFRYGLSDIVLPDQSWMIFVGCREEVFPRNIYPGCYVLNNGDSYSRLASDVDQTIRFVSPGISVVVLLPMLDDYSNGCACARSLDTAAKIKIMGESSLVFTGLWFGTHVLFIRLPSKKYKIAPWKKNKRS